MRGALASALAVAFAVLLPTAAGGQGVRPDPQVATLLRAVSPSQLRAVDSALVAFGTRHTLSDTLSATRGIGAARRYLAATLAEYGTRCGGCLRIEYDTATIGGVPVVNVLAWLPGADTGRAVVMGAHYDSCICSLDPRDAVSNAPGANDDGSGSAAVVELARVFSLRYPKGLRATIVFALYAGEEQGLFGSTHLARRLHASGVRVTAALTDDVVGNVTAADGRVDRGSVRIFSGGPDNGPSRELARHVVAAGRAYLSSFEVVPVFRLDRIGRGGDHIPFYRLGDPALRFTERLEHYGRQHRPDDVLGAVDFGYLANVTRLNAVAVATLAAAPPAPDSVTAVRDDRESGGQHWHLRWKAVPGASRYEVLLRRTTAPVYERVVPVGDATSYRLSEQLDDLWAAVRAVDSAGHASLATVVPPTRTGD